MKKLVSGILSIAICFGTTVLAKASEPEFSSPVLKVLDGCEKETLTADSLRLCRASDEELEELAKFYKDVEIGYFLRNSDRILTEQEALTELKRYNSGANSSFIIKDAAGNIVGELILTALNSKVINLAYWIIPEFKGHGYAAKACELLIKELHKKDSELVFLIGLDEENSSSKRVVEKLETALTTTSCDDFKGLHYEVVKWNPLKIKYEISKLNENNFKFNIFVDDKQIGSAFYTKEQIENVTYKRIFDEKKVEITRLNYYIMLVH